MSKDLNNSEFSQLLLACHEMAEAFPEGIVFIGGIAVYLHSINNEAAREFAEFTHHADFYISMADMSDLRDLEELTPNRRLNKHQLIKRGFEFDIYTERHSALIVPYDQVIANAIKIDKLKIAALEQLFILKLEAYRDRYSSSKGSKDAKDLIRIAIVSQSGNLRFNYKIAAGYLSDEHLSLLQKIERGPEPLALAKGNSKEAKYLRELFSKVVIGLKKVYDS